MNKQVNEYRAKCDEKNIVQGDKYRITVLTEGLVRLEYNEEGIFEDRPTQVVCNRDFAPVNYTVKEKEDELQIFTNRIHLIYDKKPFSRNGLSIQIRGNISNYHSIWHYGEELRDLKGTARTLDRVDGACELESGLMSRFGFTYMDDSKSVILTEDGWVEPRKEGIIDIYFWGYGHDYVECLKDFYYLCGKTPMLPRYAMGNWWSRYFEYSEESYMKLIQDFQKEEVPFTVAVIDMDWHVVKVDPKYGSGWTGYTWNKDLFPDPERFLKWLHKNGMKTTLNIHPADGVKAHEDMYPEMARAMGIDPATEEPVNFDISNRKFLEEYFNILHHPYEDMGVDFWWVDWQQGSNSKIPGLDPLWMLNHYHFYDNARNGKRPMTFSRYSGPGAHRYPVGFSGDTYITWESLDFQPYFTATASNIGYGWWSHDIGGHMLGYKNDEMAVRWLQLGVFSPINRLHSTKDLFYSKEPWFYGEKERRIMGEFLRLRHEMIPYLYTMNYRAYKENLPLIQPMYYSNPEQEEAYNVKNQYWFGSEMIVAPITEKAEKGINRGKVTVWLPEGSYVDFFTNKVYEGGRTLNVYRELDSIPVFVKAGGIIPMTSEIFGENALKNPENIKVKVFAGADGSFTLYEDDNETEKYKEGICAKTSFSLDWKNKRFCIAPVEGDVSLVPEHRNYEIEFCACSNAKIQVYCNEKEADVKYVYDENRRILKVILEGIAAEDQIIVELSDDFKCIRKDMKEELFDFLNRAEIEFIHKRQIYDLVAAGKSEGVLVSQLQTMGLKKELLECILEILFA